MTSVSWVARKHWHPEAGLLARLRALAWILLGYEYEICGLCGGRVDVVWTASDGDWQDLSGFEDGGVLCVGCFDTQAERRGRYLRWVPEPLS